MEFQTLQQEKLAQVTGHRQSKNHLKKRIMFVPKSQGYGKGIDKRKQNKQ